MNQVQMVPQSSGRWSRRRFAMAVPLLAGVPAVAGAALAAPADLARASRVLMGTRVDMAVPLAGGLSARQADAAMQRAFAEMQRLEALMSRYLPGSDVARLDAAAGGAAVAVAPEVLAVLRQAQRLHRDSGGAFDATVGALDGWHFESGRHAVPAPRDITRALALVDGSALTLDESQGTAQLRRHGMRLDLGGVAKLPILQAGLQVLECQGIEHALVNGGGDVLVLGNRHGQPWRVGVRNPAAPGQLLGVLPVQGRVVVASSGDYERAFVHQGRHLHHVLDPRTGWPTQGVHGVALLARSVDEVNGWGTALMVQGLGGVQAFGARRPEVGVLGVAADGTRWMSGPMGRRLQAAA